MTSGKTKPPRVLHFRFAQRRGWKVELLSYTEAETGGYKEVIAQVIGWGR